MGIWHESIYGNDIAMDIFCDLKQYYEKWEDFNKALEKCKESNLYKHNEGKLIIADAEYFYNGRVSNLEEINNIINDELDISELEDWSEPEIREKYLIDFKDKINNEVNTERPTHKDILIWIEFIKEQDII